MKCDSGVPRPPTPQDPTVGLCLGPYGGPDGEAFTYVRGTPAHVTVVARSSIFRGARERPLTASSIQKGRGNGPFLDHQHLCVRT